MTIEEWRRIADGWRDTDEPPGELIRALAAEVERLRGIATESDKVVQLWHTATLKGADVDDDFYNAVERLWHVTHRPGA